MLKEFLEEQLRLGWCIISYGKRVMVFEKMDTSNILIGVDKIIESDRYTAVDSKHEYLSVVTRANWNKEQYEASGWRFLEEHNDIAVYLGEKSKECIPIETKDIIPEQGKFRKFFNSLLISVVFIVVMLTILMKINQYSSVKETDRIEIIKYVVVQIILICSILIELFQELRIKRWLYRTGKNEGQRPNLYYGVYLYSRISQVTLVAIIWITIFLGVSNQYSIWIYGASFLLTSVVASYMDIICSIKGITTPSIRKKIATVSVIIVFMLCIFSCLAFGLV